MLGILHYDVTGTKRTLYCHVCSVVRGEVDNVQMGKGKSVSGGELFKR